MAADRRSQAAAAGAFVLPPPPPPIGSYRAVVLDRGTGLVSGQFPLRNGALVATGLLGAPLAIESGRRAAEVAALNVLAQIDKALVGFERLLGLRRVHGILAAAPGFAGHAAVLDGASDLFVRALGGRGRHARSLAVATSLPLDAPIELVVDFAYADAPGYPGGKIPRKN